MNILSINKVKILEFIERSYMPSPLRYHNIIKQLDDGFFPKKEVAISTFKTHKIRCLSKTL